MNERTPNGSHVEQDMALLSSDEQHTLDAFLVNINFEDNPARLLASIPRSPSRPSHLPLQALSTLLERKRDASWPALQIHQTYQELWKQLPESSKSKTADRTNAGVQLVRQTLKRCKATYTSLLSVLHDSSDQTALIDPETGNTLSHRQLFACIRDFSLPVQTTIPTRRRSSLTADHRNKSRKPRKPVVAISLPNGFLLALTVLCTATHYTAAPVAHGPNVGAEQFKSDVLQSRASHIVANPEDVERLGLRDSWLDEYGIRVTLIKLSTETLMPELHSLSNGLVSQGTASNQANGPDDIAILLTTSGTSGKKKVVPLRLHSLLSGVSMVASSWGLDSSMRCLNQMPLNHSGGLVRNLFSPVVTGGSIICCKGFEGEGFWECVERFQPTWYYASPSMHQGYLTALQDRSPTGHPPRTKLNFIANAAGGLLPSLANQLRSTFQCPVLPSYGMTECMPISSPPRNYNMTKPGTSGRSVGPEISIRDLDSNPLPPHTTGHIHVRGSPVFEGYLLPDHTLDTSCFSADNAGWFETGDLGYLDPEGYLYITGRSKEVINRGGELISPFEIEDAVITAAKTPASALHDRVDKALAFSIPHDVLQEVVGVAITAPRGALRPSLKDLQDSLRQHLAAVKIPLLIVYMGSGLPTNNNKILRINLADRLSLPEMSVDNASDVRRTHWEADCPPPDTSLKVSIPCRPVEGAEAAEEVLKSACREILGEGMDVATGVDHAHGGLPELWVAPKTISAETVVDGEALKRRLRGKIHGYQVPVRVHLLGEPFARTARGEVDKERLSHASRPKFERNTTDGGSEKAGMAAERAVAGIFAKVLSVPENEIDGEADFFELGGDSLTAGRVLSALRKEFKVRLSVDLLFTQRRVGAIAAFITETTGTGEPTPPTQAPLSTEPHPTPGPEDERLYESTSLILLFLHLLPLSIFFPMKRALGWTIFAYFLVATQTWRLHEYLLGRVIDLVCALALGQLAVKTIAPIVAILFKWLVVGRYREGLYPMYSAYHTRWWLVQKALAVSGLGVFNWSNTGRVLYHRLLGANIGRNVTIAKGAELGEQDLLTLGPNVALERCTVRAFAAEINTRMYLGRITLHANSSVGLASTVAPGTTVPPGASIGPNSSSWELPTPSDLHTDHDDSSRSLGASQIPPAHPLLQICLGWPIHAFCKAFAALPWLACLVPLVIHQPEMYGPRYDGLRDVIIWFASPQRVAWHILALAVHTIFAPAFYFLAVVAVKRILDTRYGRICPGSVRRRSNMVTFRLQLMRDLMPSKQFHKLVDLFGAHYEMTSVLARALGAKVGRRVYWPGTGPSVQDFDLLEIGDDVVFGSRSHIVTSDGLGSDFVRIGAGAMVADRVVLLPGVVVGQKAVMGSGALTRREAVYPDFTTWVGSKNGDAICLTEGGKSMSVGDQRETLHPHPYGANGQSEKHQLLSMSSSASTLNDLTSSMEMLHSANNISNDDRGSSSDNYSVANDSEDAAVGESLVSKKQPHTPSSTSTQPSEDTSPFGRAFYLNKAPYRVWGQKTIFLYSILITTFTALYWNLGSLLALQFFSLDFRQQGLFHHDTPLLLSPHHTTRPLILYTLFTLLITILMTTQSLLTLTLLTLAKNLLLGTRRPGPQNWDRTPYCQRWQLYLKLETSRRNCYGGNGILDLLTSTHYLNLYYRSLGANIGANTSLFASGRPSLTFTEPDLLHLGERVSVDDASLVGHVNTSGFFELNNLYVGDGAVLRSGSRLLPGAVMEREAVLLEHTLVMAGETVEEGVVCQGWPAEEFKDQSVLGRLGTLRERRVLVAA